MYEKLNTETNTIESVFNIHERYWDFFVKYPMASYLLDFEFSTQDLKNDQTLLICTAKLLDRSDSKVLLKTVSSIDLQTQHAYQYVESYAAARLFNRLCVDKKLEDDKPATEEKIKALATQSPTSTPTQNTNDHVDLDLPQIGELIPDQSSAEQVNHSVEPESDQTSSTSEPNSSTETPVQVETQSDVDTTDKSHSENGDAEMTTEQSVSMEANETETDESPVTDESNVDVDLETQSEPTQSSSEDQPQEELPQEQALESDSQFDGITPQTEEALAVLDEQIMEELEDGEVSDTTEEHFAEQELQAMSESEVELNEADLQEVSIALPTADMFGDAPVNTDADTQAEAEVDVVQNFEMLDQLEPTKADIPEATEAEEIEPQVESKYDETNHPQDVPGTIWGNVVAAVKQSHGNDWKLHLPNNMEEAIVILQSN
ncbi:MULTISPECIES: hypothetical protein [Vibrio]|uniref:hypothetical protein n=1 Tax=Vibrio TaxID=662 RepID=UPI00078EE600|nr:MULTISPECIES: hypothetical protein [Vibrio]BAU70845.1 hypothetical protein [Vibrio sp. 04Ya108]BBM67586.1 hypothetical protein VA249_42320 [Vibrio alfacsensis]BCN27069.1 hypothetical protein VYA_42610 [Vibrio alfacsensis]